MLSISHRQAELITLAESDDFLSEDNAELNADTIANREFNKWFASSR